MDIVSTTDTAAPALRRGFLWLGAASLIGITVELAVERHWTQPVQFVAWAAVVIAAVALMLAAWSPSRTRLRGAQILAALVIICALFGIWEHVEANYDAGELDYRTADTWETTPEATRWWLAISKSIGPSPPLAPAALAEASLCVLLATWRHPALRSD